VTRAGSSASAEIKRLFFALWPDAQTRRALQRETRAAVRCCGGRPVPPSNYHVTLAFVGPVAVAQQEALVLLAEKVPMPVLDLEFDHYGCWSRPGLFWIGPSHFSHRLTHLVECLWGQVEKLGIRRERKAYQPHLTLCRKLQAVPELAPPRPVRWRARDFVLVESVTAPTGARYRVVTRFSAGSSSEPNTR